MGTLHTYLAGELPRREQVDPRPGSINLFTPTSNRSGERMDINL
jgi:hypothetical protein